MNITKLITFVLGIVFIVILYVIIYYALKIMYKDIKTGGKRKAPSEKKYGIEIFQAGSNLELEEGSVMLVQGDVKIGRKEDNDIILTEPFVSGNHAKVYVKNNNIYLEDLNSTNGIFVNEEKVEGKIKLIPNDKIRIGTAVFNVLRSDKM